MTECKQEKYVTQSESSERSDHPLMSSVCAMCVLRNYSILKLERYTLRRLWPTAHAVNPITIIDILTVKYGVYI